MATLLAGLALSAVAGQSAQAAATPAGPGELSVDVARPTHELPSRFDGAILEDLSNSISGGLYGELLDNRSMMESTASPVKWSALGGARLALDRDVPLNAALDRSLRVDIPQATGRDRVGVVNRGYFGVPVEPGMQYSASFFAQSDKRLDAPLTLTVESADGTRVYARGKVRRIGTTWKRYQLKFRASKSSPAGTDARFTLTTRGNRGHRIWLSNVSVFRPTYRNAPNGLRPDLMELLKPLGIDWCRAPGGTYIQGSSYAGRFQFKQARGPVWTRPGHMNEGRNYFSSDGMGILEYLTWCEQLGGRPVLNPYAGFSPQLVTTPRERMGPVVQEALDYIEYAIGDASTEYGRLRAQDGHPKPFGVEWVELGNEEFFDLTKSYDGYRYPMLYDAIRARYPKLKIIAADVVTSRPTDFYDEHTYAGAPIMNQQLNLPQLDLGGLPSYDLYPRDGRKYFMGEYGAEGAFVPAGTKVGEATGSVNHAVADASYLAALVRNSDIVEGQAYAPTLVNVNNAQWQANLIGFDGLRSYGSPTYWMLRTFAEHHGDQVLSTSEPALAQINTFATKSSKTGVVELFVVNYGAQPATLKIRLEGAQNVAPDAQLTVITGKPSDRNSIADPRKVVPRTSTINGVRPVFSRSFPANSVSVITIG